ncbi:alanine racemase [Algirhabdus cladophorae]|uniref:alanine racemase n=1 Tax=Algirhabdus cladophorae TaxID=3377108 RepID=UPI003B84A7FF
MSTSTLTIDLNALVANWRALDALSGEGTETAAVVKADGYGLGAARVAKALAKAGAKRFFVAVAEEGAALRDALGPTPEINVFSGHMAGDTDMIGDMTLTPMINSLDQLTRHIEALPNAPFGIQLDTGMNRLGMEASEWAAVANVALSQNITLVMSHLACADEPDHPMNAFQLQNFKDMTQGIDVKRSLAATGGTLLGKDYHFDLTRPGVGLYGGAPFSAAKPVAYLSLPVIQTRDLVEGEAVGYGNAWIAKRPSKIATVSAGYADGLIRAMGSGISVYFGDQKVPVVGRVSMDLITVDITDLHETPRALDILNSAQTVEHLASAAGTIGYEILTNMGARYTRRYAG